MRKGVGLESPRDLGLALDDSGSGASRDSSHSFNQSEDEVRKLWKLAAVTGVAVAVGTVTSIGSAYATPPTGYGFDNTAHIIVGGGSDTTYRAQQGISDLWSESGLAGCPHITANGPAANSCNSTGSPETNTNLGNYQGDTIAQANPIGSGSGIASLNGNAGATSTYQGTVNPVPAGTCVTATPGVPNVDYARSSRAPVTSGGKAPCGNELTADTYWGYAQDGVEVTVFNSRGAQAQGAPSPALTPQDLFDIWNCSGGTGTGGRVRWSDVISTISPGSATDADIVPWQMNTGSGTFGTFQSYIATNATGVPPGWSPDAQACDRKLANGNVPLENDIKPLVNDPAVLGTGTSADNPVNWIWWGSFGVFSSFPYTSAFTRSGTPVQAIAAPVNGILPSSSRIIANTYPIGRTLYNVTRKSDADCPKTGGVCDFTGNVGPSIPATGGNDLNVAGGTSGISGAIREYMRFTCRVSALQQGLDPFTGTSFFSEITTAINNAGFTVVPSGLRTAGTRCQVLS
jgi:ABC-type phosphate transport system substrate-binding protein